MIPSSDDERDNTRDLPAINQTGKESLEEFQRIRREQDEAYALSLQADQENVNLEVYV